MSINYTKWVFSITAAMLLTGGVVWASDADGRIESSARESYVFKTHLKDDSIKTVSKDGVVTLTGTVKEESHKGLAQETVASLPSVLRVDNQLEVKGERPAENSDAWIATQVKTSLLYNRHVSGIKTQVFANNGVVTLKGEAENQAQKDLTAEYAKDIKGVLDVKNEMTLAEVPSDGKLSMKDKIDDASITAQVKVALLTRHSTSAMKTGVQTNNGLVTLTGKATSDAGKAIAAKVASDVNGVTSVVNDMSIVDALSKN